MRLLERLEHLVLQTFGCGHPRGKRLSGTLLVEGFAFDRVRDARNATSFVEARLGALGLEQVEDRGQGVDLLVFGVATGRGVGKGQLGRELRPARATIGPEAPRISRSMLSASACVANSSMTSRTS